MNVKTFLKTNKYTKKIVALGISFYNNMVARRINAKKRYNIQNNGNAVIEKIQKVLCENDIFFFFDMGTLLGIVREGHIIKHDLDIDVAVYVDSEEEKEFVRDILVSSGAVQTRHFSIDEIGIVEQSFVYCDVKFDICYYSAAEEFDYTYLMYSDPTKTYVNGELSVVELNCPHICKTELYKFGNIMINVPEQYEEYLAYRYGKNWRIPDKNYVYWRGPSTAITDFLGRFEELI